MITKIELLKSLIGKAVMIGIGDSTISIIGSAYYEDKLSPTHYIITEVGGEMILVEHHYLDRINEERIIRAYYAIDKIVKISKID